MVLELMFVLSAWVLWLLMAYMKLMALMAFMARTAPMDIALKTQALLAIEAIKRSRRYVIHLTPSRPINT